MYISLSFLISYDNYLHSQHHFHTNKLQRPTKNQTYENIMLFIIITVLLQLLARSCGGSSSSIAALDTSIPTIVPSSCGSSIAVFNTSITIIPTSCSSGIHTGTTSCGSSIAAANLDETNFKFTRDIVRRNESDAIFKAEVLALNLEVAADMVDQAAKHQAIVNCTWEDFPLSKAMWEHVIRLQGAVFRYRAGVETLEPSQITKKDAAINFLRKGATIQAQIFDTEIGTIIVSCQLAKFSRMLADLYNT